MRRTPPFPRLCLLAAAAALFQLLAAPAQACSVADSYRVPTNVELAADAEIILLARVESGTTGTAHPNITMTVTPIELLKGRLPMDKPLTLPGAIAEPRFALLSSPLELEQAHPLAYIGSCTRFMFVRGATVLFFLNPIEKAMKGRQVPAPIRGMLVPAGSAFSRWAEDVLSAGSPWVRATRTYIAAAALPADRQKAMLVAERDRFRAAADQESRVVADDIDRQLAGPNKPWNQLMQEAISKRKSRGQGSPDPLRGN
ncbi:MAG TPA: hypothetical protein VF589_10125 [Allosphingosinicella sp.]|jgi:hypothetical protein